MFRVTGIAWQGDHSAGGSHCSPIRRPPTLAGVTPRGPPLRPVVHSSHLLRDFVSATATVDDAGDPTRLDPHPSNYGAG
jgi:hypothetical protein